MYQIVQDSKVRFVNPLNLDEVKRWLNIDLNYLIGQDAEDRPSGHPDDYFLEHELIPAALDLFEARFGISSWVRDIVLEFRLNGASQITIPTVSPEVPLVLQYYNCDAEEWSAVDSTTYEVLNLPNNAIIRSSRKCSCCSPFFTQHCFRCCSKSGTLYRASFRTGGCGTLSRSNLLWIKLALTALYENRSAVSEKLVKETAIFTRIDRLNQEYDYPNVSSW